MAVIWSGITEQGAVVPVQVTEEGKVVSTSGVTDEYMPKTGGNFTGDVSIGLDPNNPDVNFSINPQENIIRGKTTFGEYDENDETGSGVLVTKSGRLSVQRTGGGNGGSIVFKTVYGTEIYIAFSINGAATFANSKCGFTKDGEIFFTSRGAMYKLLVQGELVIAEPYGGFSMDID